MTMRPYLPGTEETLGREYLGKLKRAREQTQLMLSRMKPYEVWAAEVGGDSEDARLLYEILRAELVQHIDDLHPDRPHHKHLRIV